MRTINAIKQHAGDCRKLMGHGEWGLGEDAEVRKRRAANQSILEISPGCSLEGLMLKLKLQYFGHLMRRTDSFEMILMLGKMEGERRRG